MTRQDAIFRAICFNDRTSTPWSVVRDDAGGYAVIPQAYLNDGAYVGSRELELTINDWRNEYGAPGDESPWECEMALRALIDEYNEG